MNISGIKNQWLIYSSYLNPMNNGNNQVSGANSDLQKILSNMGGDTLELSSRARNISSPYSTYGSQELNRAKGPGPGPNPAIKDFLDKVAAGTATEDDLKNIQSMLQQTLQQSSSLNGANGSAPRPGSEMKDFMDKVAAGTVTGDDLKNMQSLLQKMQQKLSLNNTDNDQSPNFDSSLEGFLSKVANGTVTDSDLKDMQSLLQQMQQQSGSRGAHHGHHHGRESEGTNLTGTNLDTTGATNNSLSLKSFLDKVASGAVTDDDLKEMQNGLQQMQEQFFSRFNSSQGINQSSSVLENITGQALAVEL